MTALTRVRAALSAGERPADADVREVCADAEECVCRGNLRAIIKDCKPLFGSEFNHNSTGKTWTFVGLVCDSDDYYYGMYRNGKYRLLSCVGSIECFGYTCAVGGSTMIVKDPKIMHGAACIRGTRIPASDVVRFADAGHTTSQIIAEYPDLSAEQIEAALSYCRAKR